jgi:hypothetical protein
MRAVAKLPLEIASLSFFLVPCVAVNDWMENDLRAKPPNPLTCDFLGLSQGNPRFTLETLEKLLKS